MVYAKKIECKEKAEVSDDAFLSETGCKFKKGENNVKTIYIDKEKRFIEINFDNDAEYEYLILPFDRLMYIKYDHDESQKATVHVI